MPERGRHHERSDAYAEHKGRNRDHPHNGDRTSYDTRGHNQDPRDPGGPAGDRRAKQNRQRELTPAYRDNDHEGPSRL